MKIRTILFPVLLLSGAVATTAMVRRVSFQDAPNPEVVRNSPVVLISAQPFYLDEATPYLHRADQPAMAAGYVLVVSTDPDILPVRQTHNPMLFVGDMPVERLNGDAEGRVFIGFVPSAVDQHGALALDLATTPIYWAYPEVLPEALTPERAAQELASALSIGAAPQSAEQLRGALAEGGGVLHVEGYGALRRYGADVVERHSPGEADLISGLRAPLVQ